MVSCGYLLELRTNNEWINEWIDWLIDRTVNNLHDKLIDDFISFFSCKSNSRCFVPEELFQLRCGVCVRSNAMGELSVLISLSAWYHVIWVITRYFILPHYFALDKNLGRRTAVDFGLIRRPQSHKPRSAFYRILSFLASWQSRKSHFQLFRAKFGLFLPSGEVRTYPPSVTGSQLLYLPFPRIG